MKKVLGFAFLAIFALVLTGCGKSNTVTCDMGDGKMIVSFKDDKVDSVKMEMEMESKELASAYCAYDKTAKCNGKKITMEMPESEVAEVKGLTKSAFLEAAKENGYNCK